MRSILVVLALTALAGCAHGAPTAMNARAIGCLPGNCPERPTPAPCGGNRPLTVQAIGCLPGDCPQRPTPAPCGR